MKASANRFCRRQLIVWQLFSKPTFLNFVLHSGKFRFIESESDLKMKI